MEKTRHEAQIEIFSPSHPYWGVYTAHLRDSSQAQWVLNEDGIPKEDDTVFLGVAVGDEVVASLTLLKQPIAIPATEWAAERDRYMRDEEGGLVYETFVQTFYVNEPHRRKGYGMALQRAALAETARLGCMQMRSWSSLDKAANYQLKLKLGFAFHPEIQQTPGGLRVSGGYFVKRVN